MQTSQKPLLTVTLLLASMLTMMAGAIVAPSLPQMTQHFSTVPNYELLARLIITLPALFMALFSPISGWVIDKFGRIRLLVFSLILYAVAGVSGYFTDDIIVMLIGRAFLGIAVAGVLNTVLTLIGDYFNEQQRNAYMGLQGAATGVGGVLFISIAGILADIQWQMPFLIYLFSLLIVILVPFSLYEPLKHKEMDLHAPSSKSYPKISMFIIYGVAFIGVALFYMIPVQVPYLLSLIAGITNAKVGYTIAIFTLSQALFSLLYKFFRKRFSYAGIYIIGFMLMAVGYFFISKATQYYQYIPGLIISGFGFGLFMPNGNLWVISFAPLHLRGRLISSLSMASFFGMFLSPILMQPIINQWSLSLAFFVSAGIMLFIGLFFIGYVLYHAKYDKV